MIRFRPLLVMTVLSLAAFAILISLGRWQWQRYDEKRALAEEPVAEMTIAAYQPIPNGIQFVYGLRTDTREQGWRVFAPVQEGDTVAPGTAMLEIAPGVYTGPRMTAGTRERVWTVLESWFDALGGGSVVMAGTPEQLVSAGTHTGTLQTGSDHRLVGRDPGGRIPELGWSVVLHAVNSSASVYPRAP